MNLNRSDILSLAKGKILRELVVFFIFVLFFSGCDSIKYYYNSGKMELSILLHSKKIDKILKSNSYPKEIRVKLEFVKTVRKFAATSLGLNVKSQYLYFSNVKIKQPVYVLTVVKSTSWDFKTWWFPIVGDVPYLGFSTEKRAEEEGKKYKNKGYDYDVRPAVAFSTLGYLPDPILPHMLERPEPFIANLIFHELTHATVYYKSNTMFDEHIAVLVENLGGMEFAEKFWGRKSKEFILVKNNFEDLLKFSNFLNETYKDLDKIYKSDLTVSEKLIKRKDFLTIQQEKFNKIIFKTDRLKHFTLLPPNNARLWQNMIYYLHLSEMFDLYKKNEKPIKDFIKFFKKKPKGVSPWKWMENWPKYPG